MLNRKHKTVFLFIACAWLLGAIPLLGGVGVESVLQQYKQSAVEGDAESQFVLANCYQHGWGMEASPSEAQFWYSMAAKKEHAAAQEALQSPPAEDKVLMYYRVAAVEGKTDFLCLMGHCYNYGWGVPTTLSEAEFWYSVAAKKGCEIAAKYLEQINNASVSTETASQSSSTAKDNPPSPIVSDAPLQNDEASSPKTQRGMPRLNIILAFSMPLALAWRKTKAKR